MTKGTPAGLLIAALLFAAAALGNPAEAQQRQQRSQMSQAPPLRAEMERRIQQRFGAIVRQRLGLAEEEQRALAVVVRDFDTQRRQLAERQRRVLTHLRGQGGLNAPRDADARAPVPEDEARQILAEMRRLREEEVALYVREQVRLLEVLTPGQLLQFYGLREQLARTVERVRGGRPGGPGGPSAGPGGGPGHR